MSYTLENGIPSHYPHNSQLKWFISRPSPLDSILDAVLTVSPKRQYLGMAKPTTPVAHGPEIVKFGNQCSGKIVDN